MNRTSYYEKDFPLARAVADMKLGLALESGYFAINDGYLPGYSGWGSEAREFLFVVCNDDMNAGTFRLTLRVPRGRPHLHAADSYRYLRTQLGAGNCLDAATIRRRLHLDIFCPLTFLSIARQWFSELADEAAAATAHYAQAKLPLDAGGGLVLGRSHTSRLAAPVYPPLDLEIPHD